MNVSSINAFELISSEMKSRYATPDTTSHQGKINNTSTDRLSISEEARIKIRNEKIKSQAAQLEESMKQNPALAKSMARSSAYVRDGSYLEKLPNLQTMDYEQHKLDYEQLTQQAFQVREQRISIYEKMKNSGENDMDIYFAIKEFNQTLPQSYLDKTGLSLSL